MFFVDFDLAPQYFSKKKTCHEIGEIGQDRPVPEMSTPNIPYDPSKANVYQLGNVILGTIAVRFPLYTLCYSESQIITQEYGGLELFKGIGENMTKADPEERPLASEAAQQLEALILELSASGLRRRIWRSGCPSLGTLDRFLVKYFGAVRWI